MEKYLNKFYYFIDRIGKHNFILITFIITVLIITGLYQTFSLYTESEDVTLVDGVETYSFILNPDNTTNTVTIVAENKKNLDITIYNKSETDLKYGLYYSTTSSLENVKLGYKSNSKYLPSGTISAGDSYVVSLKVDNNSSSDITIQFGIKYGFENSGDLILEQDESWLTLYVKDYDFTINNGTSYLSTVHDLTSVPLTLVGDNIDTMCISVNSSECNDYIPYSDTYNLDFSSMDDGENIVYVNYKNSSDEVVAVMSKPIFLDTTPPTNNSITISTGTSTTRTLMLSSSGASKMCFSNTSSNANNCTNWISYATSASWTLTSGTGTKTVYAFFKDEYGNISTVVSDSVVIDDTTTTQPYRYFMEVYNPGTIYLARNDGATAVVSATSSEIVWYGAGTNFMNTCTFDSTQSTPTAGYFWCIGEDNNVYYKAYNATTWSGVPTSSYIDVSYYGYYIWSSASNYMYMVRSDGKTNAINPVTNSMLSTTWGYGATQTMIGCTGYMTSKISCIGSNGYYYYRSAMNSSLAYSSGNLQFNSLVNSSDTISYFNMDVFSSDDASSVQVMYSSSTNFYNHLFLFGGSSSVEYTATVPGNGIKTCAGAFEGKYIVCLSTDNYIYYKTSTAATWTKGALMVE